jgi:hypothetical protein
LEIENEDTDTEFCEKHNKKWSKSSPNGGSPESIKSLYQTEGFTVACTRLEATQPVMKWKRQVGFETSQ